MSFQRATSGKVVTSCAFKVRPPPLTKLETFILIGSYNVNLNDSIRSVLYLLLKTVQQQIGNVTLEAFILCILYTFGTSLHSSIMFLTATSRNRMTDLRPILHVHIFFMKKICGLHMLPALCLCYTSPY